MRVIYIIKIFMYNYSVCIIVILMYNCSDHIIVVLNDIRTAVIKNILRDSLLDRAYNLRYKTPPYASISLMYVYE